MAKASKNKLPQTVLDELASNMAVDIMQRLLSKTPLTESVEDTFEVKDGFLRTSNIWVAYNEGTKAQIADAYNRALTLLCV